MTCRLAAHVRACICDDHLVLLDLRCDRYFGLKLGPSFNPPPSSTLRQPNVPTDYLCALNTILTDRSLLECLEGRGLLAAEGRSGQSCGQAGNLERPRVQLRHSDSLLIPSPAMTLAFLVAARRAARLFVTASMAEIVDRVRRRKEQTSVVATDVVAEKGARLIDAFRSLRPLYPRPCLCLFDTLAMLEFLDRFHLWPSWVFGVAVNPFRAHCWLQEAEFVLNDDIETVRRYTPIMEV